MLASTVLLVWALLSAAAEAATFRVLLPASPDHPGKCYDPERQLVLAPGDTVPAKGSCERYHCEKSGTGFEIEIATCGIRHVDPATGCTVGILNPNLAYPRCCPEPICG